MITSFFLLFSVIKYIYERIIRLPPTKNLIKFYLLKKIFQQHGFAVAVAAENILNLYHYSNNIDHLSNSFEDFFLKLADDIATYASTLSRNGYSFLKLF